MHRNPTILLVLAAAACVHGQGVVFEPPALTITTPLETQRHFSVLIRSKGEPIERIASPDPALKLTLREDVPGELYLLTVTVPPGRHDESGEAPRDGSGNTRRPPAIRHGGQASGRLRAGATNPPSGLADRFQAGATDSRPSGGGSDKSQTGATGLNGAAIEVYLRGSRQPARIPIRVISKPKSPPDQWNQPAKSLVGKPAPAFTATTLDGKAITLGGKGSIRAIIFWAPWCEHCVSHLVHLQILSRRYCDKGVEFLTVAASGGPGGPQAVLDRLKLNLPTVVDRDTQLAKLYGLKVYPGIFLIGTNGNVQAVHVRSSPFQGQTGLETANEDLTTELDRLLGSTGDAPAPAGRPPRRADTESPDARVDSKKILKQVSRGSDASVDSHEPEGQATTRPAGPAAWLEAGKVTKKSRNNPLGHPVYLRNDGSEPLKIAKVTPADNVELLTGATTDLPPGALAVLRCRFKSELPPGSALVQVQTNDAAQPLVRAVLLR